MEGNKEKKQESYQELSEIHFIDADKFVDYLGKIDDAWEVEIMVNGFLSSSYFGEWHDEQSEMGNKTIWEMANKFSNLMDDLSWVKMKTWSLKI